MYEKYTHMVYMGTFGSLFYQLTSKIAYRQFCVIFIKRAESPFKLSFSLLAFSVNSVYQDSPSNQSTGIYIMLKVYNLLTRVVVLMINIFLNQNNERQNRMNRNTNRNNINIFLNQK